MAKIEPSYTNFNLSDPPQAFNSTGTVFLNDTHPSSTTSDNYDTSNIPSILAGLFIPHVVCTIFILARIYSRLFLLRKWFHDDTLILAAWLFSTAVCTVYSLAASTPDLQDAVLHSNSSAYVVTTYLGLVFYQLTLLLTKLSILTFYLRMFSSRPVERRLAIGTIVLVIAYGIPLLAISLFQCHPSPPPPLPSHPPPKCLAFTPLLIASASLHTATDAWLIIMIAPAIARLTIPRGQRAALATVLSLSVFVIAASLTRLQLSLHSGRRPEAGARVADTLAFFVMTVLECDVALLCACAPTLRPVLARVWPRGMGEGGADTARRRRRLRRRRRDERDSDGDDEDSVNLTVVSYHGYPWAQPTPAAGRSKNASAHNIPPEMSTPIPPPPAAFPSLLRTPTTLSLRSFMSGMAPRSRGRTVSVRGDREVLLGEEVEEKRRSSVGFEGYYDQYMGYGEDNRRSRVRNSVVGGRWGWGGSQESFVLGINDPASPSRLSPVSALSGTTEVGVDGEAGSKVVMGWGEGSE